MSLSSSETVESVALTITTFKRLDGITALLRSVGELVDLSPCLLYTSDAADE